jgi:hypothetical protein
MALNRRRFVGGLALATLSPAVAGAHTPYGQWVVYRQKHLLVGAHRGDPRTYELAQMIVAALGQELPEASARIARGPRPQRIASLMSTGQLLLAVLDREEALSMAASRPPFENYKPTPLRVVAQLTDAHDLYASTDLPDDHGWLVTCALDHAGVCYPPTLAGLPLHPGAAVFWEGGPKPT